jgi:cytochrome b involved in lipid metabolism
VIHGALYDLEEFVSWHPGGRETILLGKGRDCTALFESYHAFAKNHQQVLETYLFTKPQKSAYKEDHFYSVIKERAIAVLKGKRINPVTHRRPIEVPLHTCYLRPPDNHRTHF